MRQHAFKNCFLKQLQIGDIVLLEEANKQCIFWLLAKIIQIYLEKVKVIRLVKIETEN